MARVLVEDEIVGEIGAGILVYLGVGRGDTEEDVSYIARKILGLRIFEDEAGRMSRSVEDEGGGILVISQFTLYGDTRRGRRPSFTDAAEPEEARRLYGRCVDLLRGSGLEVAEGRFRAMMLVRADVAGPITILIDSKKAF